MTTDNTSFMAFSQAFEMPFDMQLPSPPADPDNYICPQDMTKPLESVTSLSTSPLSSHTHEELEDPSSPSSESAPTKKKRKSWGQVLPTPTTTLPPRKRAKTEAEKEQRKYERVQRNRQAAHNSRMRKQQEMDGLSRRNKDLERQNADFRAQVQRLQNELRATRGQSPLAPLSPTDSTESRWSLSAPSLCEPASPTDTTCTSLDQPPTPSEVKYEPDSLYDLKKFDDSHSAEMCSQQWTSNFNLEQSHSLPLTLV